MTFCSVDSEAFIYLGDRGIKFTPLRRSSVKDGDQLLFMPGVAPTLLQPNSVTKTTFFLIGPNFSCFCIFNSLNFGPSILLMNLSSQHVNGILLA